MLGFQPMGDMKMCRRVSAPARLLRLDLEWPMENPDLRGHGDACPGERSLYPYFFSKAEEAGILGRLGRCTRRTCERRP
jgi:hypothetical protein